MTSKWSIFIAALCGLALVAAGCGGGDDDSNKALSYDDTGTEIGKICDEYNTDDTEAKLNGKADNDAPLIKDILENGQKAIDEIKDVDANDELVSTRDEFVTTAQAQLDLSKEAQTAAESGDQKAYETSLKALQKSPDAKKSDELASKLGAKACVG